MKLAEFLKCPKRGHGGKGNSATPERNKMRAASAALLEMGSDFFKQTPPHFRFAEEVASVIDSILKI